jgi:hypothetical protein
MVDQDSLDATDLNHHSSKESDNEEMPESFGYLSYQDPNFQGAWEFMMEKQLPRSRSMLGNGSGEEEKSANNHKESGESETPQEGRPSEPCEDESTRKILKLLSSGDEVSYIDTQLPAEDIPGVPLTRVTPSSGTKHTQKNELPTRGEVVGEEYSDCESILPDQQSAFDKLMHGTTNEEVVCRDQMIEPILYSSTVGRVSHIRDPAPVEWPDHDRKKYHQVELQALFGGPIPADIQLVIRELGQRAFDGWLRAVTRQLFRPVPRPGFQSAVFRRKRLLGRTSYPTFLDMGPSNKESLEMQGLQMARISASAANGDAHF